MQAFRKLVLTCVSLAVLTVAAAVSRADTITITGVGSGNYSTATVVCAFNSQTNTLTFTITNTSAITQPGSTSTITGIGFDLGPVGNASASGLNGFTGMQAPSLSSNFTFSDADVGNVNLFNSAVLDFAFVTGSSGTFSGGSVNDGLLPGESASFTVTGSAFTGFTETQICNAIFVRFQNVPSAAGVNSDVGIPSAPVPEPTTMLLLGTGLIGAAGAFRQRRKRDSTQ